MARIIAVMYNLSVPFLLARCYLHLLLFKKVVDQLIIVFCQNSVLKLTNPLSLYLSLKKRKSKL